MAVIWLHSAATGAADGTSYADAYTTLGAISPVDAAGDVINMVHTHAESTASSQVYNFADAVLYSVDSAGVHTPSTVDNVTVTAGGDITINGRATFHDIRMVCDDDFYISGQIKFIRGKVELDVNGAGFLSVYGSQSTDYCTFVGTEVVLNGGYINCSSYYGLLWMRRVTLTGTSTAHIFSAPNNRNNRMLVEDSDFTGHAAGALFSGTILGHFKGLFLRTLFDAAMAITATLSAKDDSFVKFLSCGIADESKYYAEHTWLCTQSKEAAIYRTAGAEDSSGGFSTEAITEASASYVDFASLELGSTRINTADFTTDVTATVHFAVDGSTTALNDDEFWIEVEHVDGADNALGVIVSTKADPLATGAAPTTETSLWTGLGGTNKQMSISQAMTIGTTAGTIASGLVRVTAYVGKASQAVFVCPQVEFS